MASLGVRRFRPSLLGAAWGGAVGAIVVGAWLSALGTEGDNEEYRQRVWRKADGLPDNQVNAILEDAMGYLWVATRRGLARFDGSRFVTWDRLNTPEMDNDDCRALAQDAGGTLWVLTASGILHRTDRGFVRVRCEDPAFDNLGPPLFLTRDENAWFKTGDSLARLAKGQLRQYRGTRSPGDVKSIVADSLGSLWIGTTQGVFRYDPGADRFQPVEPPQGPARLLAIALTPSRQGGVWVMFANYDPNLSSNGTNAWLQHVRAGQWDRPAPPARPDFQYDPRGVFIAEDREGSVWLPAIFNGLNRHRQGRIDWVPMPHTGQFEHPLCFHEDRRGNLWIGTETDGLQGWEPRRIRSFTTRDGLPHDNCWTVLEATDGAVWIGTDGGVSRFNHGTFTHFGENQGLSRNTVRALAETHDGTVWIGTGDGLNAWRGGQLTPVRIPGAWVEGKVRVLLAARDGALWVGTAVGLQRFQNDTWTKFTIADGLRTNDVRALLEDRAGTLWIGTGGGGLSRWRDGAISTLTKTDGLGSDWVWALHEDAEGTLWIGTENGLSRLSQDRISTFTTQTGLPVNLVNHILEDDAARLWISHDQGVYRVRRSDLEAVATGQTNRAAVVVYAETEDQLALETNGQKSQPAGCRSRDGRLWFPTTRGVLVFDPSRHHEESVPPRAVVEQVRANGRIVYDSAPNDAAPPPGARTDTHPSPRLELAPGTARVLELHYNAPTLVAAQKTRFRYRLRGLDDHWIEAGTRREAYFTDLRPGLYRFELAAIDSYGVASAVATELDLHLKPFLHQTWSFRAGCAGLAVLLAGATYRWRMRQLRYLQHLEQQAALANERARIAKDLHDGLGADLSHLTMLAELAGASLPRPDQAEPQLRSLAESSRRAIRTLKEIIWTTDPADASVEGTVSQLCHYAEHYLATARIQTRFDLAATFPDATLPAAQRQALLFVTKEALHNVAKHSRATEVALAARATPRLLVFTIQDNGEGFAPGTQDRGGQGRGLPSMRQRIEQLGGRLEILSGPGQGTTVRIELQLSANAGTG